MIRPLALMTAVAALAVTPIAAQAAQHRAAAPVSSETEELRGGMVLPLIGLVGLIIVLYLAIDSEEDLEVPDSP